MQEFERKKLIRVVDANFNRAKEGLRVCEDICRFFLDSSSLTKNFKDIRHSLTDSLSGLKLTNIILSRDIEKDVGRSTSKSELKRAKIYDIFYANIQRVKESLRVLEEFTKLINGNVAVSIKEMRYKVYALEQKVVKKF